MKQFNDIFKKLVKKNEIGLIEKITLFFNRNNHPILRNINAKIDSGNDGVNVLHGKILKENEDFVIFKTINNKILKMNKIENIIIHIGSGNKEVRPVVEFDVEFLNKKYQKIPFSIADREENEEPILICKDFISLTNALINVNKNDF